MSAKHKDQEFEIGQEVFFVSDDGDCQNAVIRGRDGKSTCRFVLATDNITSEMWVAHASKMYHSGEDAIGEVMRKEFGESKVDLLKRFVTHLVRKEIATASYPAR